MDLIEKKIIEALPETPGASFDFKGVYVDPNNVSHNVTVFDTEYFITNVIQLYRNRKIIIDKDQEGYLAGLFRIWKSSRENLYLKQAYAYTLKYNPITNYDMLEVMTDDETVHTYESTKDRSYDDYKETQETTPYTKEETEISPYTKEETEHTPYTKETVTHVTPKRTEETTPYTKETTTTTENTAGAPAASSTSSIKAFNSGSWTDTNKTENNINNKQEYSKTGTEKLEISYETDPKDETTYVGTEKSTLTKTGTEKHTLTKTGKEKVENSIEGTITDAHNGSDTDTRNYQLTRVGNIGVQTVSDMLQKEYDNLMQDLAHRALFEFIDRYTWYSEEVD